jgi:hypothetical protein
MNADPSGTPNAGAGARRRRACRCTRNDDPETKRILAHDRSLISSKHVKTLMLGRPKRTRRNGAGGGARLTLVGS